MPGTRVGALFVAEGLGGVDPGGLAGGEVGGEEREEVGHPQDDDHLEPRDGEDDGVESLLGANVGHGIV